MSRADHAREVRYALTDPRDLCNKLRLTEGSKKQARGLLIRCCAHGEKNPSCSVTTAPDGTIRVKCFGCDFAGDALTLIAHVHGLSLRTEFREVLATGAELAGHRAMADEIRDGAERPERRRVESPEPQPEPEYPPETEVRALWDASVPVDRDALAVRLLMGRSINFELVATLGLARSLAGLTGLPSWAAYGGRPWSRTGHALLVPAWDPQGALRSVRAWRVTDGDSPKRLPPRGHKAAELVQANLLGVRMLRRQACPLRLWIVEGEPDYLTAATTFGTGEAVIGIGSGSWTGLFAERVPKGTTVYVATHPDEAGDRYAEHVIETLGDRCPTYRWRAAA